MMIESQKILAAAASQFRGKKGALKLATSALIATTALSSPARADWNGMVVNGSFSTNQTLVTQFVSPQVVGPATEFTGAMRDGFAQNWTISVDVSGTFFTVSFNTPGSPGGNIASSSSLMVISLSGLTGASGLTLQNYSCLPAGFPCTTFNGGPNVASLSSTSTTATVSFDTMRNGEVYRFGVNSTAVPEAATWAMMIAGFGLVGASMRRRTRVAVRMACSR